MSTTEANFEVWNLRSNGPVAVSFETGSGTASTSKGAAGKRKGPWVPWYKDDKEPDKILELILSNNLIPGILGTKTRFLTGLGILPYVSMKENGKRVIAQVENEEIEDWLEQSSANSVYEKLATDYLYFGNAFCELLYTPSGQIGAINHLDATRVRSGELSKSGYPDFFYVCADWSKAKFKNGSPDDTVTAIRGWSPDFDPEAGGMRAVVHLKRYCPGHPYYPPPEWSGSYDYIRLANQIPAFHANGLSNGYNIKYHIKVPSSYMAQYSNSEERDAKKGELRAALDSFLSGTSNAGKSIIEWLPPGAGPDQGWTITPIQANLNDTAYSALFEQTNTAVISSNSIHPSLCGIEAAGKLSSGSEMRMAYQTYLALNTPNPRRELTLVLRVVQKTNGWPKQIKWAFEDIEITTLDQNPLGRQVTVTNQPQ